MSDSPAQLSSPEPSETTPGRKKGIQFWRFFWLTFLVVSIAYAWYSFYAPANEIAWAENYASAQQQAAESGRPVILYFTGKWCSPCRIMKRQVWADDQVERAVNMGFVPVAIDVDSPENAALVARYGVRGAPVTMITDAQGNVLRWRAGGIGKPEFLELLAQPKTQGATGL